MTYHAPLARLLQSERPHSLVHPAVAVSMIEIARGAPRGNIVEVGVYQGGTAWNLAGLALEWDVELHLFDTFTGIPWRGPYDRHSIGDFSDTSIDIVRVALPLAHIHEGLFPVTLPADLRDIAVVHADCDQYQSIVACIDELGPRMLPGGMMFFDDVNMEGYSRAIAERKLSPIETPTHRQYLAF